MKKTKLLLIFIIVPLILYLGYQVKIIYDYGIAVQQEFALKHESQLKFITNLKFNGMILKKNISYNGFDGYYVTIDFCDLKMEENDLFQEMLLRNSRCDLYEFIGPSSVVYRISKEEYDSLALGDSIFKEKGSLIIKKKYKNSSDLIR